MTQTPLESLRWRDHRAILWWLGLLYRRPKVFKEALEKLPRHRALAIAGRLLLHSLPYVVLFAVALHALFFLIGVEMRVYADNVFESIINNAGRIATQIAEGIAVGIVVGIVVGIAFGVVGGIAIVIAGVIAGVIVVGIVGGIVEGIVLGIGGVIVLGIVSGIVGGIYFGIYSAIDKGIAVRIVSGIAGGIVVGLFLGISLGITTEIVFGIATGIVIGISISIGLLRAYYYPLHVWFVFPRVRGRNYRRHPVAWDDMCSLPFWRLDRLLVAYVAHEPTLGHQEIERLVSDYPSQRHAALRAQTILLARKAARTKNLALLDEQLASLPEGQKGFLRETLRLREFVSEITTLQAQLDTQHRPVFRAETARLLCTTIENVRHRLGGFHEPLASEFRKATTAWLELARPQLAEAEAVRSKEPTPQVFRAGDPVDREQEAFVPRSAIFESLEQQVMLSAGCPGLVLYGRRRTGKSTILKNLSGFLPPSVSICTISMQNPLAFTSLASFVEHLQHAISSALGQSISTDKHDLQGFFASLSTCNAALLEQNRRLILALDEYEQIDKKIETDVFPEDLLATLRESIQSHRNLTWVFAGSHEITELTAPWTSYLVSARTIEVSSFTPEETRLLLTEPLKFSRRWPKDSQDRPRFEPGFWGEGGIEHIHAQTGGWPHLVQLVAETAIDLLNDEKETRLNAALLERAEEQAIVRGHNVLYQLMHGESTLPGEWEYLEGFRASAIQPPPTDPAISKSLRRRLLVEEAVGDAWRLRLPLMARWLRARG